MQLDISAQDPMPDTLRDAMGTDIGRGTANAAPLALPDVIDPETIALNLEASLRVHDDRHLFSWAQGPMQGMLCHEVLICLLCRGDNEAFEAVGISTEPGSQDPFGPLCQNEADFANSLMQEWSDHRFEAVVRDIDGDALSAKNHFQRELLRIGAGRVIGHGTYDAAGHVRSFFMFACRPENADGRRLHLVEMLVPFLHLAWMRTRVRHAGKPGEGGPIPVGRAMLTQREQEVLNWMYLGKSNIEIGLILGISPLTVKNHVQEILRRLHVQNRAQAVGKAFKLNILTG